MSEDAQGWLFTRIRLQFEKATAILDTPGDKKKYRMAEEELQQLRHIMCLWSQIREFCSTRMTKFSELDNGLLSGATRDHELRDLLDCKPSSFALSMLPSHQREAVELAQAQEQGASLEVEAERLKVREARWNFFLAALERDQKKLRQIDGAPEKIQALKHRKQMQWRMNQAKIGEKTVKAYMDRYCRVHVVKQKEHAQQCINEYRTFVEAWLIAFVVAFFLLNGLSKLCAWSLY